MKKNFDFYRATNPRLHNLIDQQQRYTHYLQRIQKIVQKKHVQDISSNFYMTFLHKTKYNNRIHRSFEHQALLSIENKYLLQKIVNAKNRKTKPPIPNYSLAMYEKRYRIQQKINKENKAMAKRITQQHSQIKKRKLNQNQNSILQSSLEKRSDRDISMISWNSKIQSRKLPKLLKPLRS